MYVAFVIFFFTAPLGQKSPDLGPRAFVFIDDRRGVRRCYLYRLVRLVLGPRDQKLKAPTSYLYAMAKWYFRLPVFLASG
jgi:hypothetical protein